MKPPTRALKALFAELVALSHVERTRRIARLSEEEAAELFYDWSLWARPDQLTPQGCSVLT